MAESELLNLTGVGPKAAKTLEDCGYNTIEKISKATADELSQLPGIGKATAEKIIESAKAYKPQAKKPAAKAAPKPKAGIKKDEIPIPKVAPKPKTAAKATDPKPSVKKPAAKPAVKKPAAKPAAKPVAKPSAKSAVKSTATYVKPTISQAAAKAIAAAPDMLTIKKGRIKKKKAVKKAKISKTYGIVNNLIHDKTGKSSNRNVVMILYDTEIPIEKYLGRKVELTVPNSSKRLIGTITQLHGKRASADKTVVVRFSRGVSPHILTAKAKIH